MSTEITPLKNTPVESAQNYSFSGNDYGTYLFYTRRKREKQLRCLGCIFLTAILIMSMVMMVSYYSLRDDPLLDDSTDLENESLSPILKLRWMKGEGNLKLSNEMNTNPLTTAEWQAAVQAGQEAITSRITADVLNTPLPAPSPDSRHQYAVKTSLRAGQLALGGIGELAATRYVEKYRAMLGQPTSIGSYFKNIWIPSDSCKDYSPIDCRAQKYRNYDGTCNNERNFGAALTPFVRNLPADYSDGIESPRGGKFGKQLPSAREISLKVHKPAPSTNPDFTVMLAVFGQFLDHDITATAISQGLNGTSLSCCPVQPHPHPECFPVEVGPGDPVYDATARNCMEFVRSAPAPQCKIGPREQLNQVTAFIDGSVIYGPDLKTADSLRAGHSGLLRMYKTPDNRTLLPQSVNPNDGCNRAAESWRGRYCFSSGDGRANENLHLTTMHLLWARQHNRVAEELSKLNPQWEDETIYQETRRIIGAQLQHIAYKEFLPIVLGERESDILELKPLSSGFRPRNHSVEVNPAIANSFAAAAFRFAHTLLPGLMKVTDSQNGTFSYVELHRMLFNPYSLYAKGGVETSLSAAISNSIQKTTTHVTAQLTNHLFQDPLANATVPCGLDLVSLNIQRGRDHGLPGYTAWRKFCGLGKVETFDQLRGQMDDEALNEISKLYEHVEDVDLYTGALAENHGLDGLIGPTFKCLIGDQFSRIQQGDRFWYEFDGPQAFTEGQLNEIRKATLAKLICDCSDDIDEIQPEVMRTISAKNPMTSCEDLPKMDLTRWKESSSPSLSAAAATGKPEAWLNFEKEINTTIKELVDVFKKAQITKNMEWAMFKDWFDESFAELRNNVSALSQKLVEPTKNQRLKKDKEATMDSSELIDDESISYATYDDWTNLKKGLMINLNEALVNATGIPGPEQRNELVKTIATEILEMKNIVASINGKKVNLMAETTLNDDGTIVDLFKMKTDVIKSIIDAVTRIQNDAPLPGDPAWATYGPEIKKQFSDIFNLTSGSPKESFFGDSTSDKSVTKVAEYEKSTSTKDFIARMKNLSLTDKLSEKLMNENETAVAFWDNFRDSINKSISKAIAGGKKSPLNESNFVDSRQEIMAIFAKFKDSFVGINNRGGIVKSASAIEDPMAESFWDDFRKALNESIESTAKSSPGDDAAWAAFGEQIMKKFVVFKDKFSALQKRTKSLKENIVESEMNVAFDWFAFKTDIINSIVDAVNSTNEKIPLASKLALGEFRERMMNGFEKIPGDAAAKASTSSKATKKKGTKAAKDDIFDWMSLKNDISKAVSEIIDKKIVFTGPSVQDSALNNLLEKSTTNNAFLTAPKIDPKISKLDDLQFLFLVTDWTDFKEKVNKSLDHAFASINPTNFPPPGDPAWATFRDSMKAEFDALKNEINSLKINKTLENGGPLENAIPTEGKVDTKKKGQDSSDSLANLRNDFERLQGKTKETLVESIVSGNEVASPFIPAADWISFKQQINATVVRFVKALNGTEAEEWKKTEDLIQRSIAKLRDDVISMKNKAGQLP